MAIPERQPEPDGNGHDDRLAALVVRLEALAARADRGAEPMTSQAAAAYLGTSVNTVRAWRDQAGLPFTVLPPVREGKRGIVRYLRSDLDRWVAKHRRRGSRRGLDTGPAGA